MKTNALRSLALSVLVIFVIAAPYACSSCGDYDDDDDSNGGSPPGMALVPAGCFDMGDAFSEGRSDELPIHNVCVTSSFFMDVHEVANAEYAACVGGGGCTAPSISSSNTRPSYYGNATYDSYPVIYVDWNQASAYCAWEGKRLPTEAEWEYAARGGLAGNRYPWGNSITCDSACYGRHGSAYECWNYGELDNDTHPAASYNPNGYGLYDMAGNVWEWVNDWYLDSYYGASPADDPPGPDSGTDRVLRGGSWAGSSSNMSAAVRYAYPMYGGNNMGFRCARD